jgi:phage shock protein A|tara:strand:+ start:208 stop:495 length:288 start_codon:yes stop_codon:yes gene_type:complete
MAMNQSRLERENLEAHVDLCAERYRVLEEKLNRLETKVDGLTTAMSKVAEKQTSASMSSNKLIIGAAATVIAGLLSTIVLLLLNLNTVTPLLGAG